MSSLSLYQKQLLFDYCMGLTSENETALARGLISSSNCAAEINKGLQRILAPLKAFRPWPCPDYLVSSVLRSVESRKKVSG